MQRAIMMMLAVGLLAGCEPGGNSQTTNNYDVDAEDGSVVIVNSSDIQDADGTVAKEEIAAAVEVEKNLRESE